jgi:hypothetical protein
MRMALSPRSGCRPPRVDPPFDAAVPGHHEPVNAPAPPPYPPVGWRPVSPPRRSLLVPVAVAAAVALAVGGTVGALIGSNADGGRAAKHPRSRSIRAFLLRPIWFARNGARSRTPMPPNISASCEGRAAIATFDRSSLDYLGTEGTWRGVVMPFPAGS